MRICIVGCGAVGSLFAAHLAQLDDVEVWAYDASRGHVDAINANGLRLSGAGEVVGQLHATADAQELPPCDFGIVATKAMHTEPAIRATAHAFRDGSVATVQNGLGNEEAIAEHVARTGSLVGRNVLASWERGARERFVKVMPRDYRRALEEQAAREAAEAEGAEVIEAAPQ